MSIRRLPSPVSSRVNAAREDSVGSLRDWFSALQCRQLEARLCVGIEVEAAHDLGVKCT